MAQKGSRAAADCANYMDLFRAVRVIRGLFASVSQPSRLSPTFQILIARRL